MGPEELIISLWKKKSRNFEVPCPLECLRGRNHSRKPQRDNLLPKSRVSVFDSGVKKNKKIEKRTKKSKFMLNLTKFRVLFEEISKEIWTL